MKIFTSAQIHELDNYTIEHEPISSIDLMERAAKALTVAVMAEWSTATPIVVFAGPGNNGGDALAMARMLVEQSYNVTAYLFNISGHLSEDCAANKARLLEKRAKTLIEVKEEFFHMLKCLRTYLNNNIWNIIIFIIFIIKFYIIN